MVLHARRRWTPAPGRLRHFLPLQKPRSARTATGYREAPPCWWVLVHIDGLYLSRFCFVFVAQNGAALVK